MVTILLCAVLLARAVQESQHDRTVDSAPHRCRYHSGERRPVGAARRADAQAHRDLSHAPRCYDGGTGLLVEDALGVTAAHAACCTALHGVCTYAEPPMTECATPLAQKVARQYPLPYSVSWGS